MMFKTREYSFHGNSYKIAYVDPYPWHASWFTFEDESSIRNTQWNVEPGDAVIDVGAAYGSYAITALASGASRVWAWSPQGEPGYPAEREFFLESLKLNGWEDRCRIYDSGLFDQAGWLDVNTQVLSSNPPTSLNHDIIKVDTLDSWYEEFLQEYNVESFPNYWLKLDVEGAEVEVLKSAKKLISELKPKVQVELHLFKRSSIGDEVRSVLDGFGYEEISSVPYHSVSHSLFLPK